jgi:hypothetical protein
MSVSELINEIVTDWAYRVNDGMPNPNNPIHVRQLGIVLNEMGLGHVKSEILEGLREAESKQFSNPILNKSIKYKNTKGEDAEGIVGNLLRLPKEHPGRVAAEKLLPPDAAEKDAAMKDLGSEKDGKSTGGEDKGKTGDEKDKGGEAGAGGEDEKAKAAQAMFDPKNDPAMAARLDKEKEMQAKLAEPDSEKEKSADKDTKENDFNPIESQDVSKEMPQADPETFNGASDIPDDIDAKDLEKFNTDIKQVGERITKAKANGEPIPNINLCDITVAGTNLYCDDNLGIPRAEMPQFKGKPQPGTPAADMPKDEKGEVDTEPLFKKMLEEKGIKVVQTEVPADKLKATQSELVGDKVIGMMNALENDPNNPDLTAPIYVSRDGYVIDGHHRWAAITAYNAKHPEAQIPMKVQVIDQDIKDAIPMCNEFAEKQGVAAKKADANHESDIQNVTSFPEPKPEDPEEKKSWFQKQKERIKQKFRVMKEAGKQFFDRGGHKPGSAPRRTIGQAILNKIAGIPKAVGHAIKHHIEMFGDAIEAGIDYASHGKLGMVQKVDADGRATGEYFHYADKQKKDADGKPLTERIPQYETDSHGHAINDPETGKPMQKRHWLTGNLLFEEKPIPADDSTEEEKKLFYESYNRSKKQKKAVIGSLKAVAITAVTAYGVHLLAGAGAMGAPELLLATTKELVPHAIGEGIILGVGKAALFAGGVTLDGRKHFDEMSTTMMKYIGEFMSGDKEIPADVLANAMDVYNNIDKIRENMDKIPKDEGFLKDYIEACDKFKNKENGDSNEEPKSEMTEENLNLANKLTVDMIYGFIDEVTDNPKLAAKSKETGKLVYFKTPQSKDAAIKAGTHEDPKAKTTDEPKTNIKGASMFDTDYVKKRDIDITPNSNAEVKPTDNTASTKSTKGESKTIKGKTSGKEIKTIELDGGAQIFGVQHRDKKMVDDIINQVKSTIPQEKWKDIVFLGEGGARDKNGKMKFHDEVIHAANEFKKMGAGIDSWDGDDLDVHNDQSKLYKKQKEKTGLNDNQVKAGNWASMIGQGEGTKTMNANDYLDDEGKQFLQNAAKEAGLPPIENWDNPTGEAPNEENPKGSGDRGTLYRLSFPEDNGDKETKINDIQVAFNETRDENLLEKTKELQSQGKIPITIAGEGHVDLVNNMIKNENSNNMDEISVRFAKLIKEVINEIKLEAKSKASTATGDWKLAARKGGPEGKIVYFQSPEAKKDALAAGTHIDVDKALQAKGEQPKNEPVAGADLFGQDYKDARGDTPTKSKGKKKKEKEFPKGYIAPTIKPSQVKEGLDNGDLTALTECNDNLLHNRDIGVSGMGGPVASYGEAGLCRTANILREKGYEGFVDDNIEAVNAKMQQIKDKKSKFQKAINAVAIQLGYELPKDEELAIQYLGARLTFSEQEFQRLSSNPDSIWTKEGKQGFGQDRDAFDAWAKAIFDGALSTKSLIENESLIDTTKPYVVIQSNTIEGEGHDEGILNHLKGRLEKAKESGNQEDIQHYSEEIDAFTKLGFHDTMAVGFDKKGRTCVFSITNKKQDDLADIWGNTTPAYMLNIIKKQFDPKVAIKVIKVIDAGIADVSDAKMATNREFANFKLDTNFIKVLETPELKKYTTALKTDKKFNAWLKEKMGKKYPPKNLQLYVAGAQQYVQSQIDAGENPSYEKFGKLLTKVGELGQNPKYIRKYKDSIKFNSGGIQAAVENKNSEKELTAKVHKNVVNAIESADKALKTWPDKEKGVNGPHKQAYVTTVIHSMHLDLMITNYDKRLGAITGIRGTTSADFRNCMSELSGFTPNPKKSEAENRAALNKHLVERCTLDPVSHAILIKNGKGTVTLAEDTWRTAGTSQKVEKKLGDGLRGCVASKADARQKSNRQAGK